MLYTRYTCISVYVDIHMSINIYNFIGHLPKYIWIFFFSPSNYDFEDAIARNTSCNVFVFSHEKPPSDFFLTKSNNTHFIRSAIVPNDPADFSRNSYETQTLNNALGILKHKTVDILKIEHVLDQRRSYELLYYLINDGVMKRVNQVYFSVLIGKKLVRILKK